MSGEFAVCLGPLSIHLWLIVAVLAAIRLILNYNQSKTKGDTSMTKIRKLNTVSFTLTGLTEMVWDIGTKVAAA